MIAMSWGWRFRVLEEKDLAGDLLFEDEVSADAACFDH